jgi:hypothetical protein
LPRISGFFGDYLPVPPKIDGRYLMQESGMRSLISASKRTELDDQVSKSRIPDLTREAAYATFGALLKSSRSVGADDDRDGTSL